MKTTFSLVVLFVVIIGLFNTSCVMYRDVTANQISKMPPFDATVVEVDMSHSKVFGDRVGIYLKKADGHQIAMTYSPANAYIVNFARFLVVGHRYSFPQVFADYENNLQTNRPPNTALEHLTPTTP
jgi:hypothetical protein